MRTTAPPKAPSRPNGDIYVADGYGSQLCCASTKDGKFLSKFGGKSTQPVNPGRFMQAHGIALDSRGGAAAARRHRARPQRVQLVHARGHARARRVSARRVCQPPRHQRARHLYSGVCFGAKPDDYRMWQGRGFVTILDDAAGQVVSNPGGHAPSMKTAA
jgi:peptidylamidoglycolate lyase